MIYVNYGKKHSKMKQRYLEEEEITKELTKSKLSKLSAKARDKEELK